MTAVMSEAASSTTFNQDAAYRDQSPAQITRRLATVARTKTAAACVAGYDLLATGSGRRRIPTAISSATAP